MLKQFSVYILLVFVITIVHIDAVARTSNTSSSRSATQRAAYTITKSPAAIESTEQKKLCDDLAVKGYKIKFQKIHEYDLYESCLVEIELRQTNTGILVGTTLRPLNDIFTCSVGSLEIISPSASEVRLPNINNKPTYESAISELDTEYRDTRFQRMLIGGVGGGAVGYIVAPK
ncbi:MAG: hypothetical protein JJV93_02605 [Alphaproteobacteria bacterium]|nr:hypothetical protein [Alphaproteobacteria bacterium]MBL0718120.1 hypothetical protein [Alphaproteobacteria bacterium]